MKNVVILSSHVNRIEKQRGIKVGEKCSSIGIHRNILRGSRLGKSLSLRGASANEKLLENFRLEAVLSVKSGL